MLTTRVVSSILGRMVGLGFVSGVIGAFWGLLVGGFFGAVCATLLGFFDPNIATPVTPEEYPALSTLGGVVGACFGVCAGSLAGVVAGVIVAGGQKPDVCHKDIIRRLFKGSFYGSALCATAGALSGTALHIIYNSLNGQPQMLNGVFDLGGGFCLCSVAGFGLGACVGAVYYGLHKGDIVSFRRLKRVENYSMSLEKS